MKRLFPLKKTLVFSKSTEIDAVFTKKETNEWNIN